MTTTTSAAPHTAGRTDERVLVAGRRRARLNEALLGLLFVAPVAVIAMVFQLFPVLYGFYLSMQGGVITPEGFVGLKHYVSAMGSLAYMIGLVIAVIFALAGWGFYSRARQEVMAGKGRFWTYLAPGFLTAAGLIVGSAITFLLNISYALLPLIMVFIGGGWFTWLNSRDGRQGGLSYVTNAVAVGVFTLGAVLLALFVLAEMHAAMTPYLILLAGVVTDRRVAYIFPLLPQILALSGILAATLAILFAHEARQKIDAALQPGRAALLGIMRWVIGLAALLLIAYVLGAQDALRATAASVDDLTTADLRAAVAALNDPALAELNRVRVDQLTEGLRLWEEVFTILLGTGLIALAWYFWTNSRRRESNLGMMGALLIAMLLMIGGWLFIGVIPAAGAAGDPEFYASLLRTFAYAATTVPIQLALGLLLAYLLYYEVRTGKGFFRIVFFMPYIAPAVATATVFAMIFSLRPEAPANQIIKAFGLPAQEWLRNPDGIFQILAELIGGPNVRLPSFLVGPSLPLVSAILYAIWVFSGYNAVIFMAGLGNVPKEMYEAAQVDGAGRWMTFRQIIFPLISPTTFFLTILAVIGTLRAFTHIYVLRTDAARGAMDTTTIYIYQMLIETSVLKTRPYASALSFLLFGVILVMTLLQNRLSKDRVFYG